MEKHTHVLRHGNSYACTEAWKLNTYACTETWKYIRMYWDMERWRIRRYWDLENDAYAGTEAWNEGAAPWSIFFLLCFGPWQCRPTQIVNNCSCKRKTVVLYQAARISQPLNCELHVVHQDHPWYVPNSPKLTKMVLIKRSTWFCIKSCPQYLAVCM